MNLYQDHTDAELVPLLVQGDAHAFEAIYRRYAAELYASVRKNISVKEDCEEIVQDVFEDIWVNHSKLGFITMLRGYLHRTLRFRIIGYFRHHAVRKKYEEHFRLFEAMYETFNEGAFEPDAMPALIDRSLSQLPERCQHAVRLRLRDNLSNDDIARRMNINKSTVENYMVTALAHLRASFQGLKIS
jgi:RNA polymerase sigma-70 factor (ECF subfamily)